MSYEYIAGFFDGEGSVVLYQGRPVVTIVQARRNNLVLRRILGFLESDGVSCGLYHVKPRAECFKLMRMSTLKINSVDSNIKFLKSVLPFLYVKRTKTMSVLDHAASRTYNTRAFIEERLALARTDYISGMSAIASAKKNNVCWKVLRASLRKHGIDVRGQSASKKLWWASMPADKRKKICDNLEFHKHPSFTGQRANSK